jgi:hypothetical protein
MHNATPLRFAIVLSSLLWTTALSAADKATIEAFITEPPTLVSLGFEWRIEGDDNRNAIVSVSYRRKGEQAWKDGPPLLRIGNERVNENALQYVTPNGFAGSIFDLDPGAEYECRFVMSDPDGVLGKAEHVVTVRTRVPITRARTTTVSVPTKAQSFPSSGARRRSPLAPAFRVNQEGSRCSNRHGWKPRPA